MSTTKPDDLSSIIGDLHGTRIEMTLENCSLISIHVPWYIHVPIPTIQVHIHTYIHHTCNFKILNSKFKATSSDSCDKLLVLLVPVCGRCSLCSNRPGSAWLPILVWLYIILVITNSRICVTCQEEKRGKTTTGLVRPLFSHTRKVYNAIFKKLIYGLMR